MWTVVYIAQSKSEADRLMRILCEEGLLVKLRSFEGKDPSEAAVEIMVPATEADEALDIIHAL